MTSIHVVYTAATVIEIGFSNLGFPNSRNDRQNAQIPQNQTFKGKHLFGVLSFLAFTTHRREFPFTLFETTYNLHYF